MPIHYRFCIFRDLPVSARTDSELVRLRALLGPWATRFDADLLETCGSTNTELLARAIDGAVSGSVLWTRDQTAGRGRRGRGWISTPGDSLTFSLLWRFDSKARLAGLSLAVGLAVARACDALGVAGVALKWPNDIWLNGRKLGGILVEMNHVGVRTAAVIGIGLNLAAPTCVADQPVAGFTDALGGKPEATAVLAAVLQQLGQMLSGFTADGFTPFQDEWNRRNAVRGAPVRVVDDAGETPGICLGVDAEGALLLETEGGVRRIIGGDVSLRGRS